MEMLWNLKYGETPKADLILGRMSEAGICLLTGEMENTMPIPVDLNTSNMLPTNMANISKSIIENIHFTYNYKIKCPYGLTFVFNTPHCFVDYNKTIIIGITEQLPAPTHNNFIEIYEMLMNYHVKGVDKIRFEEDDSCMTWVQLQRYWFSTLDKNKSKKKVITLVN